MDETLIIFDWDDTLFPSHEYAYLKNINCDKNIFISYISYLEHIVYDLLVQAQQYGKVIILTNAQLTWVTEFCIPTFYKALLGLPDIEIISARDKYENINENSNSWKYYALGDFLEEKKNITNVVSITDYIEDKLGLEAAILIHSVDHKKICYKNIQLKREPHVGDILKQLVTISKILKNCVNEKKMVNLYIVEEKILDVLLIKYEPPELTQTLGMEFSDNIKSHMQYMYLNNDRSFNKFYNNIKGVNLGDELFLLKEFELLVNKYICQSSIDYSLWEKYENYSVAIIGTDISAYAAALRLIQHNIGIIFFENNDITCEDPRVNNLVQIKNYPGNIKNITGNEFYNKIKRQVHENKIPIKNEIVKKITRIEESFRIITDSNIYNANYILFSPELLISQNLNNKYYNDVIYDYSICHTETINVTNKRIVLISNFNIMPTIHQLKKMNPKEIIIIKSNIKKSKSDIPILPSDDAKLIPITFKNIKSYSVCNSAYFRGIQSELTTIKNKNELISYKVKTFACDIIITSIKFYFKYPFCNDLNLKFKNKFIEVDEYNMTSEKNIFVCGSIILGKGAALIDLINSGISTGNILNNIISY